MTRYLIIIGLLIPLFFLVRETAITWKYDPLADSAASRPMKAEVAPMQEVVAGPYPPLPEILPDLGNNYLFNEKRTLTEEEEEKKAEIAEEEKPTVDMSAVTYVGSVITRDLTKAIISYTEKPDSRGRGQRRSNPGKSNYTHLVVGDAFYNYTVTAVLPDRIVFLSKEEQVEKMLYDLAKKRLAAPVTVSRKPTSRTERPPSVTPDGRPISSGGDPINSPSPSFNSGSSSSSSSSSSSFRKSQALINLEAPSFPEPGMVPGGMNEPPLPMGGTPGDMNEPPPDQPPDPNEPPSDNPFK